MGEDARADLYVQAVSTQAPGPPALRPTRLPCKAISPLLPWRGSGGVCVQILRSQTQETHPKSCRSQLPAQLQAMAPPHLSRSRRARGRGAASCHPQGLPLPCGGHRPPKPAAELPAPSSDVGLVESHPAASRRSCGSGVEQERGTAGTTR